MINCIIVDDEPLARTLIESYVKQVPDMECLGSFQTVIEAFSALHQYNIDVIFLDIEMPNITGLNFIKSVKTDTKVIFITAYPEYAVEAFEVDAIDFLMKPVTFERFFKAIQKIHPIAVKASYPLPEPEHIFLKIDRRLMKVVLSGIIYIEGFKDYIKVHTTEQTYLSYMTMRKIESLLPSLKFIRIHRSTIVNTNFIQFVEGNYVKVRDLDLAIGPTYRDEVMNKLNY